VAEKKSRMGELGGLAINTIHIMDCMEGMQRLPAGSVDIIVTSPPYNIGKDYNSYDDRKPREDYLDWMGEVAAASVAGPRRRRFVLPQHRRQTSRPLDTLRCHPAVPSSL